MFLRDEAQACVSGSFDNVDAGGEGGGVGAEADAAEVVDFGGSIVGVVDGNVADAGRSRCRI